MLPEPGSERLDGGAERGHGMAQGRARAAAHPGGGNRTAARAGGCSAFDADDNRASAGS